MNSNNPASKNTILVIICLATTLVPFMGSAMNLAIPVIAGEFSMNAVSLSWVVSVFLLVSAIFPVPFSKLADKTGRKKIFLTGIVIFLSATFVCAFANAGWILISGRALQGVGASMMYATNMAILTSVFPPDQRGKALGINTSVVYVSLSSGPFIGGLLTQYFGWRSIFYFTIIISFLTILGILLFLKDEWKEPETKKTDWIGILLYGLGLSATIYGFSNLPSFISTVLLISGIIILVIFILHENRIKFPVLYVRLFMENKVFGFASYAALINYSATYAITFILSLYLQYVKGFSPQHAGMILIVQPVLMAVMSPVAGYLSDKTDARLLATSGMGIIVIGLLIMLSLNAASSLALIISISAILGIGFGTFSSPNINVIMGSVEKRYVGMASATTNTMRMAGQALSMGITMMIISIFVGKVKLTPEVLPQFMKAFHITFIVMAALCCLGVYTSWNGTKIKK